MRSNSNSDSNPNSTTDQLSNLPRDVIFDVLAKLPTKSLFQFACVSKSCPPLISHPQFVKLHLSQPITTLAADDGADHRLLLYYESNDYTKDYYSFRGASTFVEFVKQEIPIKRVHGYIRIVGSSKGLVCLFDTNYFTYIGKIVLWNPSIRKFTPVQDSHRSHRFSNTFSHMVVGFGFVSNVNDFKVVEILYDSDSKVEPVVLVYSLNHGCWRRVGAVGPCFVPKYWSNNVFVNGAVHWMAYRRPRLEGSYNSIMAFDMGDEVFRVMDLPSDRGVNYDRLCLSSSALEESLAIFFHFPDGVAGSWDIWLMKEYGVAQSWTRQFTILQVQISMPLCFMRSGEVLLVMDNGKLVYYDPQREQIKDLDISGVPSSFRVVGYTATLALLDGGDKMVE